MPDGVRRMRLLGSGLVAIALAVALVGCTGGPAATRSPSPTPTSAAVPSSIPNDPALRADVRMRSCAAVEGGWAAAGRIANTSGERHDYRITVLFTSKNATVIGVGATTVPVKAGAQRNWRIRSSFVAASPTLCVLSGVADH
ncbi:hypothetical protein GCM10009840_02880 [Pseudolysinimonas kribbensis]|uniref:Secreted protein n=2 Tax=Pseudolysinimonas kribbensis TaxID=433641 RepID=A0ABQ6K2A9_9MICO|nr:hypothetical protein GCM10025881_14070 [Pseudolysinimonas kribbensis]